MPMLKFFLSTGSKDFRNGAAEFLIANPDLAEKRLNSVGKITPLGKYIVIRKCIDIDEQNQQNFVVNGFLCFGYSEQIRNLCSLAYFRPGEAFKIKLKIINLKLLLSIEYSNFIFEKIMDLMWN